MVEYILISLVAIAVYVIINIFKKLEVSEDKVLALMDSHEDLKRRISDTITYMREIDSKGGFESDDEVGTVFDALKHELELLEDVYDIIDN